MAASATQFAQLLREGIAAIAARTGQPKGVIHDELGYALGRAGGSAIAYWSYGDGHLPRTHADVEQLARELVRRGHLDRDWLADFLTSAGYPDTPQLECELFGESPIGYGGSLPTPRAPRHNLPTQTTRFIGRQHELAEIRRLLLDEPDCRLLNLCGPGGIGKTRLALAAAAQCLDAFPDGVILVSLAPVGEIEFLVPAIAEALRFTFQGQTEPKDQLLDFLSRKQLLLVADNFEHLRDGADLLSDIVRQAPAVTLLVTSRERLQLQEEWLFDVQGLRYPGIEPEDQGNTDLADYEAGQLFLGTAQRVKSDFAPDHNDRAHIVRICRLVGGMPLGIELAASWVRLLPCAEIAHGIAHDLDMLTTAWRDVPERHRSIQAVLDHSWKLLTAREQDVFLRLTVFSGSFGREAAATIAGASLKMLLSLVDKSFLQRTNDSRFDIHELVKQYGHDKLQADRETWATTRLRHCRYHATLLDERMRVPDADHYLNEIEEVFDDVWVAWRYAVENGELVQIQQLAEGFQIYFGLHSWYRAGSGALALYQQALACFDLQTRNSEHRATIACLYESLGDLQELITAREEALAAFEKALGTTADNDYIRRGRLYGKIADTWVLMNRHEQGHEYYMLAESVLAQATQRVTAWWREWLRIETQRMELYYWQNRPDDMAELARQIHPLLEQHGSVTQRVRYLFMLGNMALRRDRFYDSSDAIAYFGEALALSLETGNLVEIAYRHLSYGISHLSSDHFVEAETHLQVAREMTEQYGDLTLLARPLPYLAVVYRKQGDMERVREYAAYGLRIAEKAKMPVYTGMARSQYAWLAWRAGDQVETKRQALAAIEDWGGLEETQPVIIPFQWFALFPLMGVALQEEDIETAIQWAQHMITPSQQRLPDELTALLERAVAASKNGPGDAVRDLLRQAFQLAQALHYV